MGTITLTASSNLLASEGHHVKLLCTQECLSQVMSLRRALGLHAKGQVLILMHVWQASSVHKQEIHIAGCVMEAPGHEEVQGLTLDLLPTGARKNVVQLRQSRLAPYL